jgi:hypothetical protein
LRNGPPALEACVLIVLAEEREVAQVAPVVVVEVWADDHKAVLLTAPHRRRTILRAAEYSFEVIRAK